MSCPLPRTRILAALLGGTAIAFIAHNAHSCEKQSDPAIDGGTRIHSGGTGFAYALIQNGDETIVSNGGARDWKDARAYSRKHPGDVMFFSYGGQRFRVSDPEIVQVAMESFGPQYDLSNEQTKLGDLQTQLGDEQTRLGDEQTRLGDRQTSLGDRMAELAQRLSDATDKASRRTIQADLTILRQEASELSQVQQELSRRQRFLSQRQTALAQQQRRLGQQIGELSAQINQAMEALLRVAIAHGQAQKI